MTKVATVTGAAVPTSTMSMAMPTGVSFGSFDSILIYSANLNWTIATITLTGNGSANGTGSGNGTTIGGGGSARSGSVGLTATITAAIVLSSVFVLAL